MLDKTEIKVFAMRNEIYDSGNFARVILFKVGNKFFLFRGVQYFEINNDHFEETYEEITNKTIIDNLVSIHNEVIEEVISKGLTSIEPERFYIVENKNCLIELKDVVSSENLI